MVTVPSAFKLAIASGGRGMLAARALEQHAFAGAGHALMIDRAEDFYRFLRRFVASVTRGAR